MRVLSLLCGLLLAQSALSQLTPIQHNVRLHSGDSFSGRRLVYELHIMSDARFVLDERTFTSSEIAFFRNNHGTFANLNQIHGDKAERYAKRIREGKINLYEEIEMGVYGGDALAVAESRDSRNEMLATGEEFQYYALGDGPVKEASYRNLKADLADHPESARQMRMFRNYRYLQVGMIAAGAGLICSEIARQSQRSPEMNNGGVRMTPMIAFGVILGGSSYFIQSAKENTKWLAVDAYNASGVIAQN